MDYFTSQDTIGSGANYQTDEREGKGLQADFIELRNAIVELYLDVKIRSTEEVSLILSPTT